VPVASLALVAPLLGEDVGSQARKGMTDLHFNDNGELAFLQLQSEVATHMREGTGLELYPVTVNMDIESLVTAAGVSMMFDKQEHRMRVDTGLAVTDGLAWGSYKDDIEKTGWSELWIGASNSDSVSNDVKMYAAGWVEGLLTSVRLSQYYANHHQTLLRAEGTYHALNNIKGELTAQAGFMSFHAGLVPHIMSEEPDAVYWKHARYIIFQMWGLQEGFNYVARHFNTHTLDMVDLLLLNNGAELPTMMEAFAPLALADRRMACSPSAVFLQAGRQLRKIRGEDNKKKFIAQMKAHIEDKVILPSDDQLDEDHWDQRLEFDGRCSAFIRATAGNKDLILGHATWGDYTSMIRIFKYYDIPLRGSEAMTRQMGLSSYPGCISSTDDYYVLDSGLVVMDTSIELIAMFMFDKVKDFTASLTANLPNFMHILITNRLAKTPNHWVDLFSSQNSGLLNAQWMIVDYNNFIPGEPVADNVFWVLETIPGQMHSEDMSHRLRSHGFWGSYNRPYFEDIRESSGHAGAQKGKGTFYSWADNPRAVIFRNTAPAIGTLADMRILMRRNLFPVGLAVPNTPGHDIAARFDLSPTQPFPNGAIDAKITNRCLFANMRVQAISGPTTDNQRVFAWNNGAKEMWPGYSHIGQPNAWKFGWMQVGPGVVGGIDDC